jgi:DNA-binding response OmpR family regulator
MSSGARILVVEDETNVGRTLTERLAAEGFRVAWARTAAEAQAEDAQEPAALALLDVGLPDESGFELAAVIRRRHPQTAIVFVTAFGTPEDRVRGLELGAEDYVVKPFHFKELLLRIQNAAACDALSQSDRIQQPRVTVTHRPLRMRESDADRDAHAQGVRRSDPAAGKAEAVLARDEISTAHGHDEFPTPAQSTISSCLRRLIGRSCRATVIRSIHGIAATDAHAVRCQGRQPVAGRARGSDQRPPVWLMRGPGVSCTIASSVSGIVRRSSRTPRLPPRRRWPIAAFDFDAAICLDLLFPLGRWIHSLRPGPTSGGGPQIATSCRSATRRHGSRFRSGLRQIRDRLPASKTLGFVGGPLTLSSMLQPVTRASS